MPEGLLFVLWGEQEGERPHVLGLLLSALIPSPEEKFKVKKESFLPSNTGLQHQASTNKLLSYHVTFSQVLGQPRTYTQTHLSDRSSTMLKTH